MLADWLLQYREAVARGFAVAEGLDEQQFNWQPLPTAWSIGKCLMHLNETNSWYQQRMELPLRKARTLGWRAKAPFQLRGLGKWFVDSQEPPPKLRMRAPRKLVPPSHVDMAHCMKLWRNTHDSLINMIQAADGMDLHRIKVRGLIPLVRYSMGTVFSIIAAHDRRHLWQAETIRNNESFPWRAGGDF